MFHFIKNHGHKRNHRLSERVDNLLYVLSNFWKEEQVWRLKEFTFFMCCTYLVFIETLEIKMKLIYSHLKMFMFP
jgi:hypothetical protein